MGLSFIKANDTQESPTLSYRKKYANELSQIRGNGILITSEEQLSSYLLEKIQPQLEEDARRQEEKLKTYGRFFFNISDHHELHVFDPSDRDIIYKICPELRCNFLEKNLKIPFTLTKKQSIRKNYTSKSFLFETTVGAPHKRLPR